MFTKRLVIGCSILLSQTLAFGQSVSDAFNFSNNELQGTARSAGFGNALGSVGGDFGCMSVNPAGIGVYRASEISVSPSLKMNGASSQYAGSTTNDNGAVINVNHFGFVFTKAPRGRRAERTEWKSVSFAFGMNKTADFSRDFTYKGKNTTSSATLAMESDANLNPGSDSTPGTLGFLGYQSYLLNRDFNGNFRTVVPFQGGIDQQKSVQTRGGINEYVLTLGGNYREKLLLGVTIGLPVLNFTYSSTYSETIDPSNTTNPDNFTSFSYGKSVSVSGNGINMKLGAIYKINDRVRVGLALHTPTYYSLTETYTPAISSIVDGSGTLITTNDFPIGSQFDYHLTTPWKGVLSGTYFFGSKGFVTADYEYVNYSSMHFAYPDGYDDATGMSFQQEESAINQQIKDTYKGASNLRVGGELVLGKITMLRAGVGYYGNAYQGSVNNSQRIDMSVGAGWHFYHFYTDIALVHSMYKYTEQPYTIDYSGVVSSNTGAAAPQATVNYQLNSLVWTLGFKFR